MEWELHQFKRNDIFFTYQPQKKEGINEWTIFIKNIKDYSSMKNYFTLAEFKKKLKEENFFLPIFHDKVQLILLYGQSAVIR